MYRMPVWTCDILRGSLPGGGKKCIFSKWKKIKRWGFWNTSKKHERKQEVRGDGSRLKSRTHQRQEEFYTCYSSSQTKKSRDKRKPREKPCWVVDAFVFDWKTFAHQIKKHHKENQKRLVQCSPQKAPYLALQYCTRTETLPFLPKLFHISSKLQNSQTRRAVSRDRLIYRKNETALRYPCAEDLQSLSHAVEARTTTRYWTCTSISLGVSKK